LGYTDLALNERAKETTMANKILTVGGLEAMQKADTDAAYYRQRKAGMEAQAKATAAEVSALRPDLAANDAIVAVLMAEPTLTVDEVIEVLDNATVEHAFDQEHDKRTARDEGRRGSF
jgi:hypothetical protein